MPSVRGYLFAIVRNLFLQHLRSQRRRVPFDETTIDSQPGPSSEKRALSRTRRQLRIRALVLGVAISVTTLPFTVVFSSAGFGGLLIDDWLERVVLAIVAAAVWGVYFVLSRRMRTSGL